MYGQGTSGFVANKADLESPRRFTFPQTIDMIIEKPFTGYGYSKFEAQYLLYTARQHHLNSSYTAGLASMDHLYNELLYWGRRWITTCNGYITRRLFCALLIYAAKRGTRMAMLALFVPITLHAQLGIRFTTPQSTGSPLSSSSTGSINESHAIDWPVSPRSRNLYCALPA